MTENDKTPVYIRVGPLGQVPSYATAGSAGCDLFATAGLTLRPGETAVLPLDLVIATEPGIEAQVRPRSGLSLRTTLRLPNSPGTIDSDYRCDVGVLIQNTYSQAGLAEQIILRPELARELAENCSRTTLPAWLRQNGRDNEANKIEINLPELATQTIWLDIKGNPYGTIYIQPGDRIAQLVFSRCLQADFIRHHRPEDIGADRGGGFGSTGTGGIA